jgi:uncharacterized HAD superfamily protein
MTRALRIGVDIDGVLADFNTSFIKRVIEVTGRDLFPTRPFDIPTWNYPEHYGYTSKEVSAVWDSIKKDAIFWRALFPYSEAKQALAYLGSRQNIYGDEVYFITARPGILAKRQTEEWLVGQIAMTGYYGQTMPTVLISSQKGLCAKALDLDLYIDDRMENVLDVYERAPLCCTLLFDQPWNQTPDEDPAFTRVTSVVRGLDEFITAFRERKAA